ncbi:MAG: HlyD family efflux transporter periplasmic adaptor subunit [Bacteroidales bacterium]
MEKRSLLQSDRMCFKVVIALVSLGVIPACGNQGSTGEKETEHRTPVTLTQPVYRDISEIVDLPAITEYLVRNVVRSSTTGIIETISVSPGEPVSRGQLLFTVKTLEAAALKDSLQNETNLAFRGIIKVPAPKNGIISEVMHQAGDFVQEGDELSVVADVESLVFILEVPFEMTGFVSKGKECTLILPDKRVLRGKVRGRLPEMNVQDQTVRYIVDADNKSRLPQNLIASAEIVRMTRKGAQVLSRTAVLSNETQTEFWVMKLINDSTAVRIPVKKGIEETSAIEITDPLFLTSDRILNSGNYGLPDTALIVVNR